MGYWSEMERAREVMRDTYAKRIVKCAHRMSQSQANSIDDVLVSEIIGKGILPPFDVGEHPDGQGILYPLASGDRPDLSRLLALEGSGNHVEYFVTGLFAL